MDKITLKDFINIPDDDINKNKNFYKMDLLDQIEFINICLKNQESLNYIEKIRHITKSTIRENFKSIGYLYDLDKKQYVKNTEPIIKCNVKKESEKSIIIKEMAIDHAEDLAKLNEKILKFKDQFDLLEKNYIEIHNRIDILESKIINFPATDTGIKISNEVFQGELKTRSFKVYENILNEFIMFCNTNKSFRQQDLISQALYEFMNK